MFRAYVPLFLIAAIVFVTACAPQPSVTTAAYQPTRPAMRWDHRDEAADWTAATLAALREHGAALAEVVPADIDRFCPAYEAAGPEQRRAFWAGLFSALAKHESTWNPRASGGGGRWLGLMQIAPATARHYGCRAQTPGALFDGADNLSCAVRIAARQVARDGEVMGGPGRWRGVARDWAPFRKAGKVEDMAAWTRAQSYCQAPEREASGLLERLRRSG